MKYGMMVLVFLSMVSCVFVSTHASAAENERKGFFRKLAENVKEQKEARVDLNISGLNVVIWEPPANVSGPWPLIIFSHGFHGCNTQSTFLTESLAAHGYLVAAPDHEDAYCGEAFKDSFLDPPPKEELTQNVEAWTPQTYESRQQDIHALLDGLKSHSKYNSRIDWSRIGIIGHSMGGYTGLGVAGGWPEWKMPEIKAVLALSPYCHPFSYRGTLSKIDVPVMYQGGTLDVGITKEVERKGGCYDQARSPAYFVEFKAATHFAWTDILRAHHDPIILYSQWFFDRHLQGKKRGRLPKGGRKVTVTREK